MTAAVRTGPWAFAFAAAITLLLFAGGLAVPRFSPDSWAGYELSKTVFSDFYRYNTQRQFETTLPYSHSFPPLWPVLQAALAQAYDLGIYGGYVLNLAVCLLLLAAVMELFHRLGLASWWGAACYLALLGFGGFLNEALSARTIPLALLLTLAAILPLARSTVRRRDAAFAGACMGLACLARFDALFLAGVLALAFAWRLRPGVGRMLGGLAAFTIAMLIVLSPWMAYGMKRFGKPLPSDNTRQLLAAQPRHVMDYFDEPPPAELRERPAVWLKGLLPKTKPVLMGSGLAALGSALVAIVPTCLILWGGRRPARLNAAVLLGIALIAAMIVPLALVGYYDLRYFSGPLLVLLVGSLAWLATLTPDAWSRWRIVILLLLGGVMVAGQFAITTLRLQTESRYLGEDQAPRRPTAEMEELTAAIRRDTGTEPHRVLITDLTAAARYGAVTGEPTSMLPNFIGGSFASFARRFGITHVYDVNDTLRELNPAGAELISLDLPRLYRVRLPETPSTP